MILKGNSRGGAKDLALHLMKQENEHVEVYELRGFVSENLMGALNEAYAVSRGTRCKQFLYSLSLNPPKTERVNTADFVTAIEKVEERLGLSGQARAIVFHEKEGRRHAHCVWSRIDTEHMKAVQISFDRRKLNSISRELFIQHDWQMPDGLADASKRDPKNFTLDQWQQAKRIGKDARAIKTAFQDAWAVSDSKVAFVHAMRERGYVVARGDRKGRIVAVDVHGEIYSIPRYANEKTEAVRDRLGDESALPNVNEAKAQIAGDMLPAVERLMGEVDSQAQAQHAEFESRRKALVEQQRVERLELTETQEIRRIEANRTRQGRFRTGFKGLWDRLNGERKRISQQNEQEARDELTKERAEKDMLVFLHLEQRHQLDVLKVDLRRQHAKDRRELERDKQFYVQMQLDFNAMRVVSRGKKTGANRQPSNRGPIPRL